MALHRCCTSSRNNRIMEPYILPCLSAPQRPTPSVIIFIARRIALLPLVSPHQDRRASRSTRRRRGSSSARFQDRRTPRQAQSTRGHRQADRVSWQGWRSRGCRRRRGRQRRQVEVAGRRHRGRGDKRGCRDGPLPGFEGWSACG